LTDTEKQTRKFPVLWNRGGLSLKWIRVLLSSDALFVKSERDRYNLARSVVELRRSSGILQDEEDAWDQVFETAIYYANMVGLNLLVFTKDN
jgi:hypothetical protein